jgi:drug/metabolite transporter (DMT)-like permease
MNSARRAALSPYLLLACLALVWGLNWPITKIGLRDLPPFTYGTLRVATGLVVIVAVVVFRRGLRLPSRHDLPIVVSVGIGQMAAGIADHPHGRAERPSEIRIATVILPRE